MHGGTDQGCESEGYYAAELLARERAEDAVYAVRAWSRGFAWLALFAALGGVFAALSVKDYLALAGYLAAVVVVFLPRVDARIVYEVIRTEFIRRGLLDLPGDEKTFKPFELRRRKPVIGNDYEPPDES
jgi:hypothetical protein